MQARPADSTARNYGLVCLVVALGLIAIGVAVESEPGTGVFSDGDGYIAVGAGFLLLATVCAAAWISSVVIRRREQGRDDRSE